MTRDELLELVAEVRRFRSELEHVEVKSAHGGTPRRVFEGLSSFANRTDGGVLLFGLDEARGFETVGVGNAQRLQEDIGNLAASEMEPPLRPKFTVEQVEGETVVAVEVAELLADQKPCFYKPHGLPNGAFLRLGLSSRQMTTYEVVGYLSAREQPVFDLEPVRDATVADLDSAKLDAYLRRLRQARPRASYLGGPLPDVLLQLRVIHSVDGIHRPTLAGLLVFGRYPQASEPQLMISFVQYFGTDETEPTPRGERFLDNRRFEGTVDEMIEDAVNHVLASIRKSSLIEGVRRRDIPEYPEVAIREAIINAVAPRDYSHFVRGSHVRIRLFADRLEIQSPGGLHGNVSEETLGKQQSTRNGMLVRFMEDLHLVENRGTGIQTMFAAMRHANLEPPRFEDQRTAFRVTFRNHTLMTPDAIDWLNRFAHHPLNDHQRVALVHLRRHERITNSDYRRLSFVDMTTASQELRHLANVALIVQHGSGRWTYYTLNVPADSEAPAARTAEERVLAYVREHGSITNAESRRLLDIDLEEARRLLRGCLRRGTRW